MLAHMMRDGVDVVFMEVTSHALALHKCDAIRFDLAVFTNLTQDHLDFHGTMEEYFRAKQRLFTLSRRAVINVDDAAGREIYQSVRASASSCALHGRADYVARDIQNEPRGLSYTLGTPTGTYPVFLPMKGDFAVINSLQAAAVAGEYGISADRISRALQKIGSIPGRMEQVHIEYDVGVQVLIDYAHTPDALEKLLCSMGRSKGRILLLFGCGGDRDRSKRREMAHVASRYADLVVVTSDNSRSEPPEQIFRDIMRGIDKEKPYVLIPDRREAIRYAIASARRGDTVILAGKGHEEYEITGNEKKPFYEKEIVRKAFDARQRRQKNTGERESGI
jgi:UDP-N-acetylmuramoyl-L-alanyl-D-glutamate--2,6-diaminopimelate ligase